MKYFLLVFDRATGDIRERVEYDEAEREDALTARFEREAQFEHDPNIEIVVLGAASLEALIRTHSRYFTQMSQDAVREVALGG